MRVASHDRGVALCGRNRNDCNCQLVLETKRLQPFLPRENIDSAHFSPFCAQVKHYGAVRFAEIVGEASETAEIVKADIAGSVNFPVWREPRRRKPFLLSRRICPSALGSMWLKYRVI